MASNTCDHKGGGNIVTSTPDKHSIL
jgi:hypothetical protein